MKRTAYRALTVAACSGARYQRPFSPKNAFPPLSGQKIGHSVNLLGKSKCGFCDIQLEIVKTAA